MINVMKVPNFVTKLSFSGVELTILQKKTFLMSEKKCQIG
jgi:hypothetical protein